MLRRVIAVVLGAVLSNVLGAVWYMALQSPWMAAAGVTLEQTSATGTPLIYLAPLMSWLLAGAGLGLLFDRLKDQSLATGLVATLLVWLCGAMTAIWLSTFFGMRGLDLLWIDGGYVLAGLVIIAICQSVIVRRRP